MASDNESANDFHRTLKRHKPPCKHEWYAIAARPGYMECVKCEDIEPIPADADIGDFGKIQLNP